MLVLYLSQILVEEQEVYEPGETSSYIPVHRVNKMNYRTNGGRRCSLDLHDQGRLGNCFWQAGTCQQYHSEPMLAYPVANQGQQIAFPVRSRRTPFLHPTPVFLSLSTKQRGQELHRWLEKSFCLFVYW